VFLLAQPPKVLVIDSFETEGGWEPLTAEGCTIRVVMDRLNTREGQASLRLEAEFTEICENTRCFAGISHLAPDLSEYAFFRLWVRADSAVGAVFGIYVETTSGGYFRPVLLEANKWDLVTVPFSDFETDQEQGAPLAPDDISSVSLFLAAETPITVRINVDEFVALRDANGNGIPDLDEGQKTEAAKSSEEFAQRYFSEGDYEKAVKYYNEAKSFYQQAGNTEKVEEMDLKVAESMAWLNFENGEQLYENEEYVKAMEAYDLARRNFVRLNDVDMVDTIEKKLDELSEITGRPVLPLSRSPEDQQADGSRQPRQRGGAGALFFVLLVVLLVGVGVYVWKFRGGKEKPEEPVQPEPLKPLEPSEAKAEQVRKLKAKFVYGEINRKEYEKRLRELEDKS
jgi:tetratricopeptide (TPR) repeat protein